MTSLNASEAEANKRLLEAGTSDDSLTPHPQTAAEHPAVNEPTKRNSRADIKRLYEEQIQHLRNVAQAKVMDLKHQLAKTRHFIGAQAQDREFARVQLARLRKLLLEAEQKLSNREQRITEMQRELDDKVCEATGQANDQRQIHETECSYLQSVTADAERRADKLEKEAKSLREYTRRLTASHQDQLNETRRQCKTELEASDERLSDSQLECEQLRSELLAERQQVAELEAKRAAQTQQIAALTQKCQIAEQVIRQTQRESEARDREDASAPRSSRAA